MTEDQKEISEMILRKRKPLIHQRMVETGFTPLHLSAFNGDIEMAQLLLERKADINDNQTYQGETPLLIAISQDQEELAMKLLDWGADFEKSNDFGTRPLHAASQMGLVSLVEKLLHLGANPTQKEFETLNTPIHLATLNEHLQIVELLIDKSDLNAQNRDGNTVLHIAASLHLTNLVELFLLKGANGKLQNNEGKTYFHFLQSEHNNQIADF